MKAQALFRQGVRLAAAGRNDEAVARLEEAVRLREDHAFARLHLALELTELGRYPEAGPHLERALDLRPQSAAFHLFAGQVFFDAGDHAAAGRAFSRASEQSPGNDLARDYTILAHWAAGDRQAALRLDPDDVPDSVPFLARLLTLIEGEMRGRPADLCDKEKPVPLLDTLRIAYLLWRANLERKQGRFSEAIALADTIMEIRPGHPGAAAFQKECREAALETARRRVEEEPAAAEARIEYAALLADVERFQEAAEELDTARELLSQQSKAELLDAPDVMRLRARVSYGLGLIEEALEQTRAGAEPGFTMAETLYYLALCHLGADRVRLCVEEFEKLVARVCWAVPLRLREYQAWRRTESAQRPETQT